MVRIDSAQMYRNEREVGSAVLAFVSSPSNTTGLKREDIHFTSKLASNTSYAAARKSITQSVKESGLGYIDLFLLHSPYGGKTKRLDCWRAVEDAIVDGEVKTGGVSNFGIKHVNFHQRPVKQLEEPPIPFDEDVLCKRRQQSRNEATVAVMKKVPTKHQEFKRRHVHKIRYFEFPHAWPFSSL